MKIVSRKMKTYLKIVTYRTQWVEKSKRGKNYTTYVIDFFLSRLLFNFKNQIELKIIVY
jgi:hypothetical protein